MVSYVLTDPPAHRAPRRRGRRRGMGRWGQGIVVRMSRVRTGATRA